MSLDDWARSQNSIIVRDIPGRGRGLVAQRSLGVGESAAQSSPLAAILRPKFSEKRCASCFRENCQAHSLCSVPRCDACNTDHTGHDECRIMKLLLHKACGEEEAVLNVLLAAQVMRMSRSIFCEMVSPVPAEVNSADMLDMPRIRHPVKLAKIMLAVADDCPGFLPRNLTKGSQTVAIAKIVEIFLLIDCNAIAIKDDQNMRLGLGLYFGSSLLNHSCEPNVCVVYDAPGSLKQQIRVIRDINRGDELLLSYIDPALPVWERQKALNDNFWFDCACKVCNSAELAQEALKVADHAGHVIVSTMVLRMESAEAEERMHILKRAGIPRSNIKSREAELDQALTTFRNRENLFDLDESKAQILIKKLCPALETLQDLLHARNVVLIGIRVQVIRIAAAAKDWDVVWRLKDLQDVLEQLYGLGGAAPMSVVVASALSQASFALLDPSAEECLTRLHETKNIRWFSRNEEIEVSISKTGLAMANPTPALLGHAISWYLESCRKAELLRICMPQDLELTFDVSESKVRMSLMGLPILIFKLPVLIDPSEYTVVRSRRSRVFAIRRIGA